MIAPRWRKVFRDLWSNKTRTVLVLLSIAVGVAAIGMVMGAQSIVDRSLPAAYAATNPASATIFTINTFGDDLVESIEAMPEISAAEARRSVNVRFLTPEEESYTLQLTAIPDFDEIAINKIKPQEGAFPPEERQFLIERASLVPSVGLDDIEIGDTLEVESPSGKKREIEFAGTVHDMSAFPTFFSGTGNGYITFDTLEWMGEPRDYNQIVFVVEENRDDIDHINDVAKQLEQRMESSGVDVIFSLVFTPGEHPFQSFIDALSLILGGIGILSLFLSGFLIINTLSAILTQHVRQIGIMKSIGARTGQITRMYVFMVVLFGILALFIAVPVSVLGAAGLSALFAGFINFDVQGLHIEPDIVLIQALIAIIVPLLAALVPIFRGVRVTVREAISEVGLGKGQFGSSAIDRFILGARRVRTHGAAHADLSAQYVPSQGQALPNAYHPVRGDHHLHRHLQHPRLVAANAGRDHGLLRLRRPNHLRQALSHRPHHGSTQRLPRH